MNNKRIIVESPISYSDRAFNYGDGCFTTIYCCGDNIELFDLHIDRLAHDAGKLGILVDDDLLSELISYLNSHELRKRIRELKEAALKILVTRGVGGRGYAPPSKADQQTKAVISLHSFKRELFNPFHLIQSSVILSCQKVLAGLKHCNRLEQVVAKQALNDALQQEDMDEHINYDAFLVNQYGYIIEASSANLFFLKDGVWLTPDMMNSGVNGVMKKFIISCFSKHNVANNSVSMHVDEASEFESAFICNALYGVQPVKCITALGRLHQFNLNPSLMIKRLITKSLEDRQC